MLHIHIERERERSDGSGTLIDGGGGWETYCDSCFHFGLSLAPVRLSEAAFGWDGKFSVRARWY